LCVSRYLLRVPPLLDSARECGASVLKLPRWLSLMLIALVASTWAMTIIAGIVWRDYQPPESVNLIFSAVMTTLILGRSSKGNGDDSDKDGGGSR
jgi:succinate dehydrogenase hydrophobic anchor subunit